MTDTGSTFREQYATTIMAVLVVAVVGGWIASCGFSAIGAQVGSLLKALP